MTDVQDETTGVDETFPTGLRSLLNGKLFESIRKRAHDAGASLDQAEAIANEIIEGTKGAIAGVEERVETIVGEAQVSSRKLIADANETSEELVGAAEERAELILTAATTRSGAIVANAMSRATRIAGDLRSEDRNRVAEAVQIILREEIGSFNPSELLAIKESVRVQHINTPLLNACIEANIPAYLHGDAGSAKTTAAEIAARKYQLQLRSISLSPSLMDSKLLGYQNANGEHVRTAFREVYEHGGIFLFDEMDNANASALAVINNALANGAAEFADSRVERHPNTRIVAAANTIGKGPNALYVGRAQIDAATLDRFAFIPWDIDENLERALVLGSFTIIKPDIAKGGIPSPQDWVDRVQGYRSRLEAKGLRHIISMRASIYGKELAKVGVGVEWLDEMLIFKGMQPSDRTLLSAGR